MSVITRENMFTFVTKHVRSRIVADLTDSYDECETGFRRIDITEDDVDQEST